MKVEKGTPIDSKDRIAEKILEGMKKANSYKGSTAGTYIFITRLIKRTSVSYSLQTKTRIETRWTRKRTIGTGQTLHTYGKHLGGKLLLPAP